MRYLAVAMLLAGCADLSMPNAVQRAQFVFIQETVVEQVRENPPTTATEAKRWTNIANVAKQGVELAEIELRLHGTPDGEVPNPLNHSAVHHVIRTFEEEVETDLFFKGIVEPFLPKAGNGLALGGGGVVAIGMTLLKMFTDKREMRRKDSALGKMFAFAEAHTDAETRQRELGSSDVQAEYAASTFKVEKKTAPSAAPNG